MKKLFLPLIIFFICGCYVNDRGISNRLYSDCKSYYDASGTYQEECPKNWLDLPLTPDSLE